MNLATALHHVSYTVKSVSKFVPAVLKTRLVDLSAPPKVTAALIPNLARYWFSLARELEQAVAAVPDQLALIDDDGTLTYRQFREDSRTLARYLTSLGLDELRIGVMARNGRGILLPMAAKGYAGAAIYLLNVGSSPEQILGTVEENDINVLILDDEFEECAPLDRPGTLTLIAHASRPHDNLGTVHDIVSHPERVASVKLPAFPKHGPIVLMSSGTSGIPKGVVRPEPKLPYVVAGVVRAIPFKAGMRIQMTASMFHTWGWAVSNIAFAARSTVITQRNFDPETVLEQIQKYRIEGLYSSPIFLKQMLQIEGQESYDTSSLQFIASSGHALTPEIVRSVNDRFGPILCNIYGSTELTLAASATAAEIEADPTVAGEITAGTVLKILGPDGAELPTGSIGRICLRNSTSLTGYTNPNIPIVSNDEGLIEIGDLGFIDEQNRLHVLGRIDDMIIVGGENVFPRSVEEILEPMPGVADLTAMGVEDAETFSRIAVWVVREDSPEGDALTEDSIRDWVARHLAGHSVPRDVHFVDDLPRNATGKVVPRFLTE